MSVCAILLAASLSRAEIIERFKSAPLTKVSGLVQVVANCPAEIRREYQSPIAAFAAETCTGLYNARREQPRAFPEPAIVVYIGDVRTNDTRVVVQQGEHASGAKYTRLTLPSPGSTDLELLRTEIVRAFSRAVAGEELDAEQARRLWRDSDPDRRAEFQYEQIERWLRGERVEGDDEEMLRLSRSVLVPGTARPADVLRFASRLYLYPESFDRPFCGRYDACSFADAIRFAKQDPRLRIQAYLKLPQIALYGGGRGEAMTKAAEAYAKVLLEIAKGKLPEAELDALLAEADAALSAAMEAARQNEEGNTR